MDPAGAPPWFRDAAALVLRNSAAAQTEAETRLAAARAEDNRLAEAYALLVLTRARGRQNDMPVMLRHSEAALALAERIGDASLLTVARNIRAGALRAADHLTAAMDLYLLLLTEAEQRRSDGLAMVALGGLAICHAGLGDRGRAIDFGRRSLRLAEKLEDAVGIGTAAMLLGQLLDEPAERAEARRHFQSALAVYRRQNQRTAATDAEEELAMLDFREERADAALVALGRIEAQRRTLRGRVKLTHTLLNRAEVLAALGRHPESLACAEEARGYAEAIDAPGLAVSVFRRLALAREAAGDFVGALQATRRQLEAELAVSGAAARRRAEELQTRFDLATKDAELARLARDNELRGAEGRAQAARLAQASAELRASAAELARTRGQRLALGFGVGGAALFLGLVVLAQRSRLRLERAALDEIRRARAAAEEAAALKTQLLGIASHDLKAPLRGMLSRADLIAADVAPEGEAGRALRGLRGEGERMLRLVHDLLDVSAIEQGGLRLKFGSVDLADLVSGIVDGHRPLAALKNLELALALPAVPPARVRGDAARLGQAIANLVDNAVKFTPPGKAVRVALEAAPGHVSVVVRDEGPGLSPEDLARMFRPFQTASAVPTGGESSSGLGLHIAQEIVARHGGRIDVDSAPWGGATFAVVLPVAVAPGDSPPAGTPAAPGPAA